MRQKALTILVSIVALLCFELRPSAVLAEFSDPVRKKIFDAVESSGKFHGYELDITNRAGTVWLRGHVQFAEDKSAIAAIAKNTKGVEEVKDELTVQPPKTVTASELARTVREQIRPLSASEEHNIVISASGSALTLIGSVKSSAMKRKIEEIARNTPGVESVTNDITVSRPSDAEITERIRQEITSASEIQIKDLSIAVQDGVATLGGIGRTHRDTDHALALTLNVPGVEDVKSEVTLEKRSQADAKRKK